MIALPLPSPHAVAARCEGLGRAAVIRRLYGQRASVREIADWLHVSAEEVRRTLHRPVRMAFHVERAA